MYLAPVGNGKADFIEDVDHRSLVARRFHEIIHLPEYLVVAIDNGDVGFAVELDDYSEVIAKFSLLTILLPSTII
jgi:hypothetical protein